eukprot:g1492.t1
MLPRYGHLLKKEEVQALRAFEALSLSGQQLFARLLCRKWPQWVPAKGLGARYRELGEEEAQIAASELAQPLPQIVRTTSGSWGPLLDQIDSRCAPPNGPWLLDSARETASSLLQRPLCVSSCEDRWHLLLSALPVGELRRMGRGLGLAERCGKSQLLEKLCEAAKQQRLLQVSKKPHTDGIEALVSQALRSGRWLCCADSMGRHALMVLGELFRIESCGAAEVSYVLFTTKWPQSMTGEDFQRYTLEGAEKDACAAEEGLQRALVSVANDFEAAKLRDPFRRRFTAAWRYAEALHHAVTNSPAVGHDQELQAAKIRRLKLLLSSKLCPAKRGRWYAELAKELARSEGPAEALELAARGLAEGMDVAPASAVDLTSEVASSQEVVGTPDERLRVLPRDARWDLARRCRTLARQACQTGKAKNAWKSRLQKTEAARQDASDGKWLSDLASRLIEEEDHATGHSLGTRFAFHSPWACQGFRLEELTVEELAMQHYFTEDGGSFQCGIHCEGAILRDLFGILLFDQMFHCSVEGAFGDSRIKAAVMMCPSLMSAGGRIMKDRSNLETPVMMMIGTEDTVLGAEGNDACREYALKPKGSSYLLEIKLGGHCSFTSCDLYNPAYGNGIGESKSLTKPGEMYEALDITKQHEIINTYGLAFLDKYLRGGDGNVLKQNQFEGHMLYRM